MLCENTIFYGTGAQNCFVGLSYDAINNDTDGDYDNDGLLNGDEMNVVINEAGKVYITMTSYPTNEDSDGDGLDDLIECFWGTKLFNNDTDNDNLSDFIEVNLWYDPLNPNYDGDSFNDYEEWKNETSPYVYNLTAIESVGAFLYGGFAGDWIDADNVEQLLGQVAVSFVPVAADARDYFANIIKNLDTGAALVSLGGIIADLTGAAGVAVDVGKALSKVGEFVVKHADDAPKVFEAIIQSSKLFKNNDEFFPVLATLIPTSAIDNIVDSIKSGSKMTKADYDAAQKLCEAAGKNLDEAISIGKKAVQTVISNKTFTNSTGRVDNYVSATKGFNAAKADFDSLPLINVDSVPRDNGTIVGYLADGRIVNVRPKSLSGYPTLQILDKNTGRSIKIRY